MKQSVVSPVSTQGMSCESHIFRVYRVYFFQVRNQVIYNKISPNRETKIQTQPENMNFCLPQTAYVHT